MNRMDKLNQLFKREISNMILMGEVRDPRLSFVSITFVDTSKDLSVAHVGFSVLQDDPQGVHNAQSGLDSASGRIRHLLSERVDIRHVPAIRFVYDNSISHGIKMAQRLQEIRQDRGPQADGPSGADGEVHEDRG